MLLALALAMPAPALASAGSYDIRPVALENGPDVPGGGFINGLTRAEGITAVGEILVAGWVWDGVALNHKVFLYGGAGDRIAIEAGEPAPEGGSWSDFEPVTNASADLAFHGVVDSSTLGSWRREGSGDSVLALPGGSAPLPGATWTNTIVVEALSDGGAALFYAVVSAAGGDRDGYFLDTGGTTQVVALNGDPAPGGGTFTNIAQNHAALIDDDSVVFQAEVAGGATTSGLYRWDAGVVTPLLVQGDPVTTPRGGTVDAIRLWVRANAAGSVVFTADILRDGNPAWPAVFVREADGTLHEIQYLGDPVPGSVGRHFNGAWYLAINASGHVAFTAPLREAPWTGLFFWDGASIRTVALEATPHPGDGLEVYQFGQRLEVEDDGRIVFDAGSTDLAAWGLFTASPVEAVPALPRAGTFLLQLALVGAAALLLRSVRAREPEAARP